MKTKPELGSNHLHGKDVGNQEDPTSCGSHHHPQKCFLCMWKDYDVWNFTWEEQKPNSCESSQKAAQQGPEKVVDQPLTMFEFTWTTTAMKKDGLRPALSESQPNE